MNRSDIPQSLAITNARNVTPFSRRERVPGSGLSFRSDFMRSPWGAVELYKATGLSHEAIDLAQPQTGSLPQWLGREERLEDPVHDVRWDAGSGVRDRDRDII